MSDTSIEWTRSDDGTPGKTWNPTRGCSLKSAGCTNCYAMRFAHRFSGKGQPYEGLTRLGANGPIWTGAIRLAPEMLDAPLKWKRPVRVFVNSMSDLFHEDLPDSDIDRVFAVMALAHQHTYQILTKRPDRMAAYFNGRDSHLAMTRQFRNFVEYTEPVGPWPLPNVWLGTSLENQATADERIPHLLRVPAAVRFLSCEPLLAAVSLKRYLPRRDDDNAMFLEMAGHDPIHWGIRSKSNPGVDWVIVGGESGPHARPMHPEWARSLRDQCVAAGVAFHFKQWGEWAPLPELFRYVPEIGSGNREYCRALDRFAREHGATVLLDDRPEGWDRRMVEDGCAIRDGETVVGRVGKKAAGRTLDGRTWAQFPAPRATAPAGLLF